MFVFHIFVIMLNLYHIHAVLLDLGPDLQSVLGKIVSLAYVFPIYEELSKS